MNGLVKWRVRCPNRKPRSVGFITYSADLTYKTDKGLFAHLDSCEATRHEITHRKYSKRWLKQQALAKAHNAGQITQLEYVLANEDLAAKRILRGIH